MWDERPARLHGPLSVRIAALEAELVAERARTAEALQLGQRLVDRAREQACEAFDAAMNDEHSGLIGKRDTFLRVLGITESE
jgi:hypothetical protein